MTSNASVKARVAELLAEDAASKAANTAQLQKTLALQGLSFEDR